MRGNPDPSSWGPLVGAIFGKNLPKKGKKVSNTSMLEIDKS